MSNELNPLLACLTSFFQILNYMNTLASEQDDKNIHQVRTHIKESLVSFEQSAQKKKISAMIIDKTKYALVAYADEFVMNDLPAWRSEWFVMPLQLEYFGEHNAGENFFEQLHWLRQHPEDYKDVLEIYYLCLQLGFEGQFRFKQDKSALVQLKNILHQQIQARRSEAILHLHITKTPINNNASIKHAPQKNARRTYILVFSVILLTFTLLQLLLSYQSHYHQKSVIHYQQTLKAHQQDVMKQGV